ncbi:hypothetical protein TNCV_1752331 [Trichonephila clavipes]|nr:hypothetical protein TNCV_1752331 [Trichonephila clavipes]
MLILHPYMQKEEAGIIHEAEIVHEAGTVQEAGIVQEENSFNLPETSVPTPTIENQHQIRRKEREQGKI